MKKLITVTWSTAREIDLPDNIDLDKLLDASDPILAKIKSALIREASLDVNWKDGEIDIDDIPDDIKPERLE